MKKKHYFLAVVLLVGSRLGMGCSDENTPKAAGGEEVVVGEVHEAITGTTYGDYKFPATLDKEITVDPTELWARVYAPSPLEDGKRYPLLVFLHGNHGACGDTAYVPRVDRVRRYIYDGYCPDGEIVVENHIGYGYIAEEMAAHGYIVVSVNANRGIGTKNEALPRGRLILKHLEKLAHWDQGLEPTPPELGFDLQGHVDFSEVGLMGHSRGGPGVISAYNLSKEDTIDWTARLGTALEFRGIFEIAPIDAGPEADRVDVPLAILLPLCDGSVNRLDGGRAFDRSMSLEFKTPGAFRATLGVAGANHNYFNTEWQHSDESSLEEEEMDDCVGQAELFQADTLRMLLIEGEFPWSGWYAEGVTGSLLQQEVGKQLMSRFFRATVGEDRDPSLAAMFDPRNDIPQEITDITPVDRGFSHSSYFIDRIELEDFQGDTGVGRWGEPAWYNGIDLEYTALWEHDPGYRGAHITWESASDDNVFEPRLTEAGQGVNLESFDTLDFRVDPANDPDRNTTAALSFAIRLVDGNGALSYPVNVSDYVTLSGRERNHSMLQTVRVPLGDFGNPIPLTNIRGVRFVFNDTPSGAIYLASIRATKGGVPTPGRIQVNQDSAGILTTHEVAGDRNLTATYFEPASWAYGPYGQESFQILISVNHDGAVVDDSYRLIGSTPHAVGTGMAWLKDAGEVEIELSNTFSNPLRFDATAGSSYVLVVDSYYSNVAVRVAGDVDGDGDSDEDDATLVANEVVGNLELSRIQSAVADVNCDDTVDWTDMQLIGMGNLNGCR